jgi:hypothetical protein
VEDDGRRKWVEVGVGGMSLDEEREEKWCVVYWK